MLFSVLHGRGKVGKQQQLCTSGHPEVTSPSCPAGALCESLEGEVGVIPILEVTQQTEIYLFNFLRV